MTRSVLTKTIGVLAVAAMAVPATAAAQSQAPSGGTSSPSGGSTGSSGPSGSGTSSSSSSSSSTPPASSAPTAPPDPTLVTAGGGIGLRIQASTWLGQPLGISGHAPRSDAGHTIAILRLDPRRRAWTVAATTIANGHGGFQVRWQTSQAGLVSLRAVVLNAQAASRRSSAGAPAVSSNPAQVTVYRPALATYFGQGFYGHQTACGQTMTAQLVGVANRTLPCGTLVDVSYGGRHLTVPVVDRGPYANGADWDLTSGAAQALGITETVHIGTIVVGPGPSTSSTGSPPSGSSSSGSSAAAGGASPS